MLLIDSHCHLDYEPMISDILGTLERAEAQGVGGFLTVCTDLSKAPLMLRLADENPFVFATIGVHPHESEKTLPQKELFDFLVRASAHPKVVGFGETGLDYYYSHSPQQAQQEAFTAHIEAALDCDLPLIVHTRDAEEDTIEQLKTVGQGKARGVIHCFSGSPWLRDQALDLGFYISVSGIATFRKAEALRETLREVPLERLLVETDSPYLAPEPYRGKSNEPAFVREIAQVLSDLKEVTLEDISAHTTHNFLNLFSKVRLPCA